MDFSIAVLLLQDGVTTGAIYALIALALILVYSVTQVPLLPIGGFLTFAALTLNQLQTGAPALVSAVTLALGVITCVVSLRAMVKSNSLSTAGVLRVVGWAVVLPAALVWLAWRINWGETAVVVQMLFALAVVVPIAPMIYRVAFQPIEEAGPLTNFMVAISIDAAMIGAALLLFGPDGVRNENYADFAWGLGDLMIPGTSVWILGTMAGVMALLFVFFRYTLAGKKLRATAINRQGAQLVGIATARAGMQAFAVAACISAVCGLLIGSTTTINSSFGILVGLKGFVTAVIAGFVSYPIAVLGALVVGLLESFSSFWASVWKDAIVFALVIPILFVRSLGNSNLDDEH